MNVNITTMFNKTVNKINYSNLDCYCEAILSNNKNRCSQKKKIGFFCTRHHNLYTKKNILNEKKLLVGKSNLILKKKIRIPKFKRNIKKNFFHKKYDLNLILKLQSVIRTFLIKKLINSRGIGVVSKKMNNNDTDCFTLENISEISPFKLFSYKDNKNFYWCFEIETFKKIIENKMDNPYNMQKIPDQEISRFLKINYANNKKIINNEANLPNYIKLQQKCVKIFQKMNDLKQYSQCKWFLNLNIYKLRELYKQIEDIWNYRAQLSNADKFKYTKNGKLFEIPVENIYKINSKIKLGNILLDEFDKLISEGKTDADKTTGALWILSSLTIVNKSARDALPWLFQSANVY